MKTVNIERKKYNYNILLATHFIITILTILYCFVFWQFETQYEYSVKLFAWLGNLIFLWGLYLFKKITATHINQYSFFFISYFMFSYGQVFLYSFGIKYERFNLILIFPNESILLYCMFFCIGTCLILFGALVALKNEWKSEIAYSLEVQKENKPLDTSIKIVSWTMFLISAPIYFQEIITNMQNSINFGYGSIYENEESSSSLIGSLEMWFIPSLFLLLGVYKKNAYIRNLILLIFIISIIIIFITGTRSRPMALIVSLLYFWNTVIKKFNVKEKVLSLFSLLLVVSILPIIQSFRGNEEKTLTGFFLEYKDMFINNNFIFDIIGELGSSMQPWLLVYDLIPNLYSFGLGESYIASILAIIPSIILGGYSFAGAARLSGWLQEAANMSYGPGFSILAESYFNFGWLGLPFLFIIGWVYFTFLSSNFLHGNILRYKYIFSSIALYIFVASARGSMYLSLRREVYAVILPIFATLLIYRYLKKDKNS